MGAGCIGILKKMMEKRAPQNGFFFHPFLMFTSNLVYSVIWNQSVGLVHYGFVILRRNYSHLILEHLSCAVG